jgi:hypothetical protein
MSEGPDLWPDSPQACSVSFRDCSVGNGPELFYQAAFF